MTRPHGARLPVGMTSRPHVVPIVAAGLLLLAGCAVGPNFHVPTVSTPVAWVGAVTNAGGSTAGGALASVPVPTPAVLTNWWAGFKDPTLNALIVRAVDANLDLKQANSRVRQARAQRGVVAGSYWPARTSRVPIAAAGRAVRALRP